MLAHLVHSRRKLGARQVEGLCIGARDCKGAEEGDGHRDLVHGDAKGQRALEVREDCWQWALIGVWGDVGKDREQEKSC